MVLKGPVYKSHSLSLPSQKKKKKEEEEEEERRRKRRNFSFS